jgi:hypothetical protein
MLMSISSFDPFNLNNQMYHGFALLGRLLSNCLNALCSKIQKACVGRFSSQNPDKSSSKLNERDLSRIKRDAISPTQTEQRKEAGFVIPERRVCGFSLIDKESLKNLAKETRFISDKEIIGSPRAMKFLPTPFSPPRKQLSEDSIRDFYDPLQAEEIILERNLQSKKREEAIAITKEGKHVILQQAAASCVPSSVAMLVLDHGGKPNYNEIRDTHYAKDEDAVRWFKEAGFATTTTQLSSSSDRLKTLNTQLKEHGPGILAVYEYPGIGSHEIVLDAIDFSKKTATIRDPFHGWQIDITLSELERICGNTFIQITGRSI